MSTVCKIDIKWTLRNNIYRIDPLACARKQTGKTRSVSEQSFSNQSRCLKEFRRVSLNQQQQLIDS